MLSTKKSCIPRNLVDSSSSSTPDRGPQFKALVSGNVETCAVWRSPGIWITSFNETTLFVSGDWRTVNSLHFLLPTKLLSCTRSSDRGHNEVSVVRVQSPGSLQTADCLDHGMGQLVKVSKRLEHWQIMYTVTLPLPGLDPCSRRVEHEVKGSGVRLENITGCIIYCS